MEKIPRIKSTILGISIAIVLVLFIFYGINTFYERPQYEDYCEENLNRIQIDNEGECIQIGGQWTITPLRVIESEENETKIKGYCDSTYTCRSEFEDVREIYNRNVFIVAVILGLVGVLVGGIKLKLASVSAGIMGGGVLTLIWGTLQYWGNLADVGRFIVLGIVLAVLIWIGYKRFKK